MGKMQREKGKRFERAIATELRKRWPDAIVRRASQADRAYWPDVFVENDSPNLSVPSVLSTIWWEMNDARAPTPMLKLLQAERDIGLREHWMPVVVWHRFGERTSRVTTRLWVVDELRQAIVGPMRHDHVVTMTLEEFLCIVSDAVGVERMEWGMAAARDGANESA